MNLNELAQAAINSINHNNQNGIDIDPSVTLLMPGKWGGRRKKYLAGPKSPQGEIVKESHNGVTVIFEATDVLAWCVSQGVDVQIITQPIKTKAASVNGPQE